MRRDENVNVRLQAGVLGIERTVPSMNGEPPGFCQEGGLTATQQLPGATDELHCSSGPFHSFTSDIQGSGHINLTRAEVNFFSIAHSWYIVPVVIRSSIRA